MRRRTRAEGFEKHQACCCSWIRQPCCLIFATLSEATSGLSHATGAPRDSLRPKRSLRLHNSQWNPLYMSQAQIECQGLWHLSKYRLQEQHPGISLVFIRRVGKPAVLGQHSRRITQICSVWHQVAARQHKSFHSSIINLTVTVEDFVC